MPFLRRAVATLTLLCLLAPGATSAAAPADVDPLDVRSTVRISGADRYATSVAVSQHAFPAGSGVAFVATGSSFPDALASGPAAARMGAPILLVRTGSVPSTVHEELERLGVSRIVVLGGSTAVSDAVVEELRRHGSVERSSGNDRFATAAALSAHWGSAPTVFLASGQSFPDALSGGAAAAVHDAPVLLTRAGGLPEATGTALTRLGPTRVVVLGGAGAVSDTVVSQVRQRVPGASVERWSGKDRYATAAVVAERAWPQGSVEAYYSTGANYPDALAGVPAAARSWAPILLVRKDCSPGATSAATSALDVSTQYVLGGQGVVGDGATVTTCGVNPPAPETVLAALADIPVKGRAPKTGYDRAEFGPDWTDAVDVQGGRNGCDTRNDVLRRDLDNLVVRPGTNGCVAQTGQLNDPYTGTVMPFERGSTSSLIHIDHLVALSDAWQKGAQQLTFEQRKNFANDPLNLWAVNGAQNSAKGDSDAATWLPPNRAARCDLVAYQTAVKQKYALWMTQAEKDAITTVITGSCPTKRLPTSNDVPALMP